MLGARETLSVGAITVKSLDHISTPKMTVVTLLLLYLQLNPQLLSPELLKSHPPVRGVVVVTIHLGGDAAPQRTLVERERETVMELVMEVIMMETRGVNQALCVEVTIVRSMVIITTRRMIAVRNLQLQNGLRE